MQFRYEDGEDVDATAQRTNLQECMGHKLPSAPGRAAAVSKPLHGCFYVNVVQQPAQGSIGVRMGSTWMPQPSTLLSGR